VGIFANPNEMAYSLIVILPLAGFLASSLGLLPRLALTGIALVYMAAIFVTFSRGGLVALGAIMGLYAWRKKSAMLQGLMVLVAAGGLLFSGQYWSRNEDFSSLKGDVSFQQRIATSQAGIAMFADNPVLGVGLGCSMIAWPLYAPENLYTRGTLVTHNTFIQALGETGLVGSIPFFLFVGAGIWYARKLALSSAKKSMTNLGIALEVSLWGFVVCGLSGGYVLTWFPYILIGLVSAARRIETEQAA
jgi:O-antigen ligase